MNWEQISTAPATVPEVLTMEKLQEAMDKIAPCPFAEFMRKQNCDPKDGWVLMLPVSMCEPEDLDRLPGYVKMSHMIDKPITIKLYTKRSRL